MLQGWMDVCPRHVWMNGWTDVLDVHPNCWVDSLLIDAGKDAWRDLWGHKSMDGCMIEGETQTASEMFGLSAFILVVSQVFLFMS